MTRDDAILKLLLGLEYLTIDKTLLWKLEASKVLEKVKTADDFDNLSDSDICKITLSTDAKNIFDKDYHFIISVDLTKENLFNACLYTPEKNIDIQCKINEQDEISTAFRDLYTAAIVQQVENNEAFKNVSVKDMFDMSKAYFSYLSN